ncbi:thioredoxin domain-containing protein [bacterium]|nr:thioredoxin domain-containing protein [bacterium]
MANADSTEKKYNRLVHEKSPYLIQHKDNPIWWYPWGEAAFAAAKRENKPVFLSIGYSTCYWCHFMEKDSFEKQDVADLLNADFIAIKVDREERPEVDNIYMTALVAMTGGGGWPMSMFLTPEGKPFFGASTIPHDGFVQVLTQITQVWKSDPDKIRKSGDQIAGELSKMLSPAAGRGDVNKGALESFLSEMKFQFDDRYAGFGPGGNKFPRPHLFMALLRIHRRSGDSEALNMTTRTLKAMARGGIHDLVAGGFHRYSVDPRWDIPHFEKMLYDNAGIAMACLEAFQATKESEFAGVAAKTLDWVLAEMTHPGGGFYSAQDAGDFGEEGDFYAWTREELKRILTPEEFEKIEAVFQISPRGNFEGERNVFHVPDDAPIPDSSDKLYASAHAKIAAVRSKRERPRLDDKVLTDWNGLMIAAMARGYQALGEKKYLDAAQKAAGFIRKNLVDAKGRLLHRWRDGDAAHPALLDDYAFLIHGLIELYQSDFDPAWFEWAVELQTRLDTAFWDEAGGAYFIDDAQDSTLLFRSKEFEDMAIPSGNAIAALNLLRLADFTYAESHRTRAERLIRTASDRLNRQPTAYPQMLVALDYALDRSKEIAITGKKDDPLSKKMIETLRREFLPNKVVALTDGQTPAGALKLLEDKIFVKGKTTAYACEKGLCKLPTSDPAELLKQAAEFQILK